MRSLLVMVLSVAVAVLSVGVASGMDEDPNKVPEECDPEKGCLPTPPDP